MWNKLKLLKAAAAAAAEAAAHSIASANGHVNEMATLFAEVPPPLPPLMRLFGNYSLFIPLVPCTFVALYPTRTCCITRNQSNEISSATRARKAPNKSNREGREGGRGLVCPLCCLSCVAPSESEPELQFSCCLATIKNEQDMSLPTLLFAVPNTHTHTQLRIKHTHTHTLFLFHSLSFADASPHTNEACR